MIKEVFKANGKDYEIRIISDGATIRLRAFDKTGKPANGYTYQIDVTTNNDLKMIAGQDGVKEMIKFAKDDVAKKRWEKFLEAVKALKK